MNPLDLKEITIRAGKEALLDTLEANVRNYAGAASRFYQKELSAMGVCGIVVHLNFIQNPIINNTNDAFKST